MKFYYLNTNKQYNGHYELHTEDCKFCPAISNRAYIGYFSNCNEAIREAKKKFPDISVYIDGCYFCCNKCHKG